MLKIRQLRIKFPDFHFRVVWNTFFDQEWDSLICSIFVIVTYTLAMFILRENKFIFWAWFNLYGQFGLAIVLGYAGQAIAYKYLNTASDKLIQKADELKDKI